MTKLIFLEGTKEMIMVSGRQGVIVPQGAKIKALSLYQWFWNIIHDGIEKKYCQRCRQWLPVSEFTIAARKTHDGYSCYCKQCQNRYDKSKTVPRYVKIGIPIPPGAEVLPSPHINCTPHIIHDGIEKKYCGHCKQWLLLTEFYYKKTNPDKLDNACKEYHKERYEAHKEYRREYYRKKIRSKDSTEA
jgi:hypothetical protein